MLQAISGDAGFLRLIRDGTLRGRVHSVFGNALNLKSLSDGKLYAVVAARFGNIPDALLVEDGAIALIEADAGAEVGCADGNVLVIGQTRIAMTACREWRGQLPRLDNAPERLLAQAGALDALLQQHGKPGGMKAGDDTSIFAKETTRALTETSAQLVATLIANDVDGVMAAAASMIGLGAGLTPSGDDFLVGLLAALKSFGVYDNLDDALGRVIAEQAATGTNIISATALNNAAQARVPETLIALITALDGDDAQALDAAAKKVLAIGSSSGTDMLYGVVAGLRVSGGYI